MLKKFAALGLSAALLFAPVAGFAQTPSPDASATPGAAEPMKPMKKKMMHHHVVHHVHHVVHHKKMAPMSPSPTPSAT